MTPEERNRLVKVTKLVEQAVAQCGDINIATSLAYDMTDQGWEALALMAGTTVPSITTREMVALVLETRVAL